jgi:DNA-binding NarL/FixJ family response regulator
MKRPPRTVLVVSSDRLFAEAAAAFLDRQLGWRVIGTTDDGLHALATVANVRPSSVLVIGDPARMRSSTLARELHRRVPGIGIAVIADTHATAPYGLPTGSTADVVLRALTETLGDEGGGAGSDERRDQLAKLRSLTPRERTALKLLAEGATKAQLAENLGVSVDTARTHTQNLYRKLGLHSRVELIHLAARHGLVNREVDRRAEAPG